MRDPDIRAPRILLVVWVVAQEDAALTRNGLVPGHLPQFAHEGVEVGVGGWTRGGGSGVGGGAEDAGVAGAFGESEELFAGWGGPVF